MNHHERDARAIKVARLLTTIDCLPDAPTADEVAMWPADVWRHVCAAASAIADAKVNPPSPVTVEVIVEELRRRETVRRAS